MACYTHVVGRMGLEESCNKMQTAVGSGGRLIYAGRSPDETNLSTTSSENTKSCLLSEFVSLL